MDEGCEQGIEEAKRGEHDANAVHDKSTSKVRHDDSMTAAGG